MYVLFQACHFVGPIERSNSIGVSPVHPIGHLIGVIGDVCRQVDSQRAQDGRVQARRRRKEFPYTYITEQDPVHDALEKLKKNNLLQAESLKHGK